MYQGFTNILADQFLNLLYNKHAVKNVSSTWKYFVVKIALQWQMCQE